ncbi:MAG: alginate O-acetyltransferase [Candidatus Magasanikbacteria bacterium RIFCSPHIGHO2_01_FULL_47_8]|uniref:Alginate O-acetyltransferase n=1 Tax=Candidatus Magasanikbacteria bacterium RIFCSPHIGHO2_01_FULL_47_8 TaxID=1798673 RepID=A0A1F6MG90_9BACT|nr:MAG: alginate O-acetyltransferase [Candidatus Magasanikbacteria bacterium RIFCSPHIGHO2_01_FULL_47_8]
MLFNSLQFLVFFPVVTTLYFILPHRWRWLLLLVASCLFYMAFIPAYILVLFAVILVDYIAGIHIEKSIGPRRKQYLIMSILANVGCLVFFKYSNFAIGNINSLAGFLHWNYSLPLLKIILPVGLSFHTFQAMSYTIEVYRGKHPAERHLGIYALYVMFFPQLVAGPIERPGHLIPQFREEHRFNYARVASGLQLMFWGFFKKLAVADRLAEIVDGMYGNPTQGAGAALFVITIFFAVQIYCDFSGYVDIARGAARVMGFDLSENFNRPYSAKSITEFWRRWHITLYQWFRDYIYIPLGGNQKGVARTTLNILIVFTLTGLWHGAKWTFVVWGLIHGFYLIFELITKRARERLASYFNLPLLKQAYAAGQTILTFLAVSFSWIFFRADSLTDAKIIIGKISADLARLGNLEFINFTFSFFIYYFISIGIMVVGEHIRYSRLGRALLAKAPAWVTWPVYYAVIAWFLWFGYFGKKSFIYFQF